MTQRASARQKESLAQGLQSLFSTVIPLLLLCCGPPLVFLLWFSQVQLDGSLLKLSRVVRNEGLTHTLSQIWLPHLLGSVVAWKILGVFVSVQLLLIRLVPATQQSDPQTAVRLPLLTKGNGLASFAITVGLYLTCASVLHLFPASLLYDHLGDLLGALHLLALLLCVLLIRFDSTLLQLVTCRIGVMSLPLLLLSFASKQQELYGLHDSMICALGLQLLYLATFFFWEAHKLQSIQSRHRTSFFYLGWGSLVWLPCLFTSSTLYLVHHPITLGLPLCIGIGSLGVIVMIASHLVQAQRLRIGSSSPYVPLLAALVIAFLWTVPAQFDAVLPYVSLAFLVSLLASRSIRRL